MNKMNEVSIKQVRNELTNLEEMNKEIVWKWQLDERILNTIVDDFNDMDLEDISLKEYLILLIEQEIYDKH